MTDGWCGLPPSKRVCCVCGGKLTLKMALDVMESCSDGDGHWLVRHADCPRPSAGRPVT